MNRVDTKENFNHKLDLLITIWQKQAQKKYTDMPTHVEFLDFMTCLYRKPHEYHIDLFWYYPLSGIYTGYFPDKHSKMIQEFFAPLITIWHEITDTQMSVLPTCENVFFLAEALSRCSSDTYTLIFKTYRLTGLSEAFSKPHSEMQTRHRNYKKQDLVCQYQIAQRRWKRIPFWVRLNNSSLYPYR